MYTTEVIRMRNFFVEAEGLLEAHQKEIDLFGEDLDINKHVYIQMEDAGNAIVFALRKDEELVGYCGFSIFFHPHHQELICSKQEIFYIDPEHRGNGKAFLKDCDNELANNGVQLTMQSVTVHKDWSKMLLDIGYQKMQTTYIKRLP